MPTTILGAVAGSQKDVATQSNSSGINLSPSSALENQANGIVSNSLTDLTNMVNGGPGSGDVTNAYNSSQTLASMLGQYANGGYQPTDSDVNGANSLFAKLFQPQQTALQQSFQDQNANYGQQAALMGRDPNDPVFRAKLAYQQSRDQQMLSAQQNSAAMGYAMQQPFQRLSFAQQQNGVLNGLASQAMANRQALASMGSGIMNDERNFRLQTGTRWGNQTAESGGGLKGALMGGLAGMSQDMKLGSMMFSGGATGAMPSAGGASAPNPFGMGASGSFAQSRTYAGGGYGGGSYA